MSVCLNYLVPGHVENFQVIGQSPNTFNILWRSPSIDNGNITAYTITVTDYTNGIIVYRDNQAAVTNDDDESYMYTTPASSQIGNNTCTIFWLIF